MKFSECAPCKLILFGEHYVVYGAPAISIPIGPMNRVEFSAQSEGEIILESKLGTGRISQCGDYSGEPALSIYAKVAKAVYPKGNLPSCSAKFMPAVEMKGIGTSSSLCAAFAKGLFALKGEKPSKKRLFDAVQAGDAIAHHGRASGIDAKTVVESVPLFFRKDTKNGRLICRKAKFSLPASAAILLIDTFAGKRSSTGEMIMRFASSFGVSNPPHLLPDKERAKILEEYLVLWKKVRPALEEGNVEQIGKLMLENQLLLEKRGVSSEGIRNAVEAAIKAGAFGAKLSGAGGEGGVVAALVSKSKKAEIARKISKLTGFRCLQATLFLSKE
ncbi:MAG: hypothetical protein QXN37_03270 [Candidatus Anstonellaceae archaeon]